MIEAANFILSVDNSRILIEWNKTKTIAYAFHFSKYTSILIFVQIFVSISLRCFLAGISSQEGQGHCGELGSKSLKGREFFPIEGKTKTDSLKVRNLPVLQKAKRLHLNTMWSYFRFLLLIDIISFIYRFINRYVFAYLKSSYRDRLNSILYLTNVRKYNRTKLRSASNRIQRN